MRDKTISLTDFPADHPIPARPADPITAPIDHKVAQRVATLLLTHGAEVRQLDVFPYTTTLANGRIEQRLCSNHKITFPAGTMRYDGLVLHTSYRFRMVFPDGFELHGLQQWGMVGGDKTLLFVPEE